MSTSLLLKAFVNERLTAAAEEIFQVFEKTVRKYEEEVCGCQQEIERLRGLLLDYSSTPKTGLCVSSVCVYLPVTVSSSAIFSLQREPCLPITSSLIFIVFVCMTWINRLLMMFWKNDHLPLVLEEQEMELIRFLFINQFIYHLIISAPFIFAALQVKMQWLLRLCVNLCPLIIYNFHC